MFLIAKIVRGRRLLHQLEQEVEKEKSQKERERIMAARASGGPTTPAARSHQQTRQNSQALEELGGGMGKFGGQADGAVHGDQQSPGPCSSGGGEGGGGGMELKEICADLLAGAEAVAGTAQKWDTATVQKTMDAVTRRKRAVRQRTDSSLPSADEELFSGRTPDNAQVRRTSSMPSVVESESHTSFPAPKRGATLRPVKHYNYEDRLSKLHKRALRFTWQRLQTRNGGKRIETVFEEVFDRMMRSLPVMREMFNTRTFISAMSRCEIASPRDHARLIVKMFEAAIKNLEVEEQKRTDTGSEFDPNLLGRAHGALRPYGFTSALWEAFGEAVIDVVLNQEAVRDLPGASQAWVVLTACLVDQLRVGFESSRDSSSSQQCPFQRQTTNGITAQPLGEASNKLCRRMSTKRGRQPQPQNGSREQLGVAGATVEDGNLATNENRRNTIASVGQGSGNSDCCCGHEEDVLVELDAHASLPPPPPPPHHQRALSVRRYRDQRCFSVMPQQEGGTHEVELKILHDMASTEL